VRNALRVALAGLLLPGALFADFEDLSRRQSILWGQEPGLLLEVERAVSAEERLSPGARFQVENRIEEALPALYIEAVEGILVDSYETVGQRLQASDALFRSLSELAVRGGRKISASFSEDMHQVLVQYRFPFYGPDGLIAPFIQHERPFPIPRILGFTPSRTFTGLVIYAQGELPSHGKPWRERANPALLPRLFDEDMNPVLSPEMCDPKFLLRWGVAAYAFSDDETLFRERIGDLPLRTMARGVFGRNATDLLLPREAARQLLSREGNRQLLREGRILIILDRPER
jgi:hypothetical protein